ncbi:hypothetical protein A2996_03355 [Candidatus Campbellbacteria bacterium RIFCSPLOWO2_01_FULL_34_15]|uniref:Uncharacterized protein n=2 Tax=Candidatus Campbelliibacteriota TaxID=1752727 RepID=A0A1F5EPM7_9BACT|nr:MAG: hypothetical protein A2811_01175 [Candidatus Campbellbacteria bacterium RIFCSPHIGHO2_01_FULL_34_10]OGD69357.1 MAG: hypothetical protein A2996_03355 [Candidatus Campbellbacteria bacterium RIFCSPLOWO2_01_FULL_34_15]
MHDDLKGLAEGFGELSGFLDSVFGGGEEKGSKEDLTDDALDKLRTLIGTNNVILKKLVAGLLLEYFVGKLSFQELEYFLHSRDKDIQIEAGKAILDFHWRSLNVNILRELLALEDEEIKRKINDYLASMKKK